MAESDQNQSGQAPAANGLARRRKIFAVLAGALAVAALGYFLHARSRVSTDDAQVDGHIYTISPRVPGYVTEVLVKDNELVEKDQPLLRLDPVEYEVALADAVAGLSSLEEDSASAGQDVQSAQSESALAQLDLNRNRELLKSQSVSQSAFDQAKTKADTARAKLLAAQAKLEAIGSGKASTKSSKILAQKAKVRQASLNLEYTTILAPARGYVTRKAVERGYMVSRGQPIMTIVPLDPGEVWITANFKETQLTNVRPGQKVDIEVDAYPGVDLKGTVDSVMAGSGASFSLFPPENAAGNYVKVVQRVPVKITIDTKGAKDGDIPPLRVGMSAYPTIHIR
ncbi:MAG: HlyD family secretion protein [Humidesulfovibrio sp.]|nr:HlyD family secretion protein [Humidesulfovibrio sp.]